MRIYERFNRRVEEAMRDHPYWTRFEAQEFCRAVYGDLHALMLQEDPSAKQKLAKEGMADMEKRKGAAR